MYSHTYVCICIDEEALWPPSSIDATSLISHGSAFDMNKSVILYFSVCVIYLSPS